MLISILCPAASNNCTGCVKTKRTIRRLPLVCRVQSQYRSYVEFHNYGLLYLEYLISIAENIEA